MGLPLWSAGKEFSHITGDAGDLASPGRFPGEGNGNPLQYSFLGNPVDRGAWQATSSKDSKELDTKQLSTHARYMHIYSFLCTVPLWLITDT